jgi:hypothetical protein
VVTAGWLERRNGSMTSVARWNGVDWSPMGDSMGSYAPVYALAVVDLDDEGPEPGSLLAGGARLEVGGGAVAASVVRWNGASWQAFDAGLEYHDERFVSAMAVVDHDGAGPALPVLYATGDLILSDHPDARHVAIWDGARWQPVGDGLSDQGWALAAHDPDGDGPAGQVLIAGGEFAGAGGAPVSFIAQWDGAAWSDLGGGLGGAVRALASIGAGGQKPVLYAGGGFVEAGGTSAAHIAAWDGAAWSALGDGVDDMVESIAAHDDDGPGPLSPALYVGGRFEHAGGLPSAYLARWGEMGPPACSADCDGSGGLDLFDLLCFVNAFNADDPAADCDGSGVLDLFDFLCFVNTFEEGCE